MSNNYQFSPTLDGLNNINGNYIYCDTIDANNINVSDTTTTNNLSVSNNSSLRNLSILSYPNVSTSLDTLFSRTTNQSWTSNKTTFATDYLQVGTTVADVKTDFKIFGSQINGIGVTRNGFMLTSPIAGGSSGQSVPMGLVNVVDSVFDIAINCGNVASSRNTTKQGCQMRFDGRNSEKCWQLQMVDKTSGTVRNAINALDTGVCEIPTQLNLLTNVNMTQSGSGIISQTGTGTNILKDSTIGNLTLTGNYLSTNGNITLTNGTMTSANIVSNGTTTSGNIVSNGAISTVGDYTSTNGNITLTNGS